MLYLGAWTPKIETTTGPFLGLSDRRQGGKTKRYSDTGHGTS